MSVLYTSTEGTNSTSTAPVRIDKCSWCLHETAQVLVHPGSWLTRAAHKCGGCSRRTLQCRKGGCTAFARGHPGGPDDDLCVVHAGAFPRWPDAWSSDARYAAHVKEITEPVGECSWCLDTKRHVLTKFVKNDGVGVTSTYACGGCARRTKRCGVPDCTAFARADESECATCSGLLYTWASEIANQEAAKKIGWCSWCGEQSGHLVRRRCSSNGNRNAPTCECLVCGRVTAECASCPGVMRAVSDDTGQYVRETLEKAKAPMVAFFSKAWKGVRNLTQDLSERLLLLQPSAPSASSNTFARDKMTSGACLRCDVFSSTPTVEEAEATWRAFETRRLAADVAARHPRDVLSRDSRWRRAAFKKGLWRPFALFATLPPRERVRLGMRLGVCLARAKGYLDPHAEAWTLLTTPGGGMCARARASVGGDDSKLGDGLDAMVDWTLAAVEKFARETSEESKHPCGSSSTTHANWLEILSAVLTAGARNGACPTLPPCEFYKLPKLKSRDDGFACLRTPASTFVSQFEETVFELVADAQRARLGVEQIQFVDWLTNHSKYAKQLTERLRKKTNNPKRVARFVITFTFAASPWAVKSSDWLRSETHRKQCATAVFACLLDGVGVAALGDETRKGKHNDEEPLTGVAVNLLSSLAAESGADRFGDKYPNGLLQSTFPSVTSNGPAGLFEPLAVMLTHGALLAARGVDVDENHPARLESNRVSSTASNATHSRNKRPVGSSTSPNGVIGVLSYTSTASASDVGSDKSLDRVAHWAAEAAREGTVLEPTGLDATDDDLDHSAIDHFAPFDQASDPDRSKWGDTEGRVLLGNVSEKKPQQRAKEVTGNAERFVPATNAPGLERFAPVPSDDGSDDSWPSADEDEEP